MALSRMVKCNEPGFESDQGWSPASAPSLMIDHRGEVTLSSVGQGRVRQLHCFSLSVRQEQGARIQLHRPDLQHPGML